MLYRAVTKLDAPFLYSLLQERPDVINISHKRLPSYTSHCNFIDSNPYKEWYIVTQNNVDLGSYYLTDYNEIGLFIAEKYQKKGIGTKVLEHILSKPGRYLANISPRNKLSQHFFCNAGFKRIQYTYEMEA